MWWTIGARMKPGYHENILAYESQGTSTVQIVADVAMWVVKSDSLFCIDSGNRFCHKSGSTCRLVGINGHIPFLGLQHRPAWQEIDLGPVQLCWLDGCWCHLLVGNKILADSVFFGTGRRSASWSVENYIITIDMDQSYPKTGSHMRGRVSVFAIVSTIYWGFVLSLRFSLPSASILDWCWLKVRGSVVLWLKWQVKQLIGLCCHAVNV